MLTANTARRLFATKLETQVTFTKDYAHPDLFALIVEPPSDPNRANVREVKRTQLKYEFDFYALGKNLFRILDHFDVADTQHMPHYHRSYLTLMAARMLDGYNDKSECALELPLNFFQDREVKYTSARRILDDIKKLVGEYVIHDHIPELDHHYPQTVQICSQTVTSFPKRVSDFISLPIVRRLGKITQLGLTMQIYPTATHTRLEHILGTFANTARYCDALWNDPINPIFRQIMCSRDIKAVLLAALCHDLGQYALAHDLEEADKNTFSHHDITERILNSELGGKHSVALSTAMKAQWRVKPQGVLAILKANPAIVSQPLKARLLHTILDGPIDADKIDYLRRDAVNLNVPYGSGIDIERLVRCLTVVFKETAPGTFITLGIHEKGKIPAEGVAFARYAMFGTVYWHHTVRAIKSMLHRAVWEALPGDADQRITEYKSFKENFDDFIFVSLSPLSRPVLL